MFTPEVSIFEARVKTERNLSGPRNHHLAHLISLANEAFSASGPIPLPPVKEDVRDMTSASADHVLSRRYIPPVRTGLLAEIGLGLPGQLITGIERAIEAVTPILRGAALATTVYLH